MQRAHALGIACAVAFAIAACGGDPADAPPEPGAGGDAAPTSPPPETAPPEADAGATEPVVADAAPDAAPAKKTLTFTWQGEIVDYWCGPSATRMALSTRMSSSMLPSQATLAQELPATTNGTDDISLVVKVLDRRLGGPKYVTKYLPDPPSAQQRAALVSDLVSLVSSGYPIVANVVSGWRPPMYPTGRTIYHYVAVVGYDANGTKALIADPAAQGHGGPDPAWDNVPRSYWISTHDLATWIAGKGYTAPRP